MTRPLAGLLLAALALSGCASGGQSLTQGGLSDAVTSFGSDHSYSFSCSKYDSATGNLTDQVVVQRNVNPNAAFVAAVGQIGQAALALAGKAAAGAATGGVGALGVRGASPDQPFDVPTCLGEHGVNTPMPVPPNPAPPPEPFVAPTASAPPDPLLEPRRWYAGPGGHVRYLEGVDRGAACWRSGQGAEHCASVADWLAWVVRPLPAR